MSNKTDAAVKPVISRQPIILDTDKIFGESKKIHIRHHNKIYQLTITRHNKLILTC